MHDAAAAGRDDGRGVAAVFAAAQVAALRALPRYEAVHSVRIDWTQPEIWRGIAYLLAVQRRYSSGTAAHAAQGQYSSRYRCDLGTKDNLVCFGPQIVPCLHE